jgi:hypothetical protein
MLGMRTPIAAALALFAGFIGGGLAVDAVRVDQAFWFDHVTTLFSFPPLFFLARSWKWLICGLPGLIAGGMILLLRDDVMNRWPELTRGPAFAMVGAALLAWLPGRVRSYRQRAATNIRPRSDYTVPFPNPFFLTGMACLLALPLGTFAAIVLVENQGWKRTNPGREILAMTETVSVLLVSGGLLLGVVGGIRRRRYRGRIVYWLLTMSVILALVVPIQFVLLGVLNISVNGIFPGGK